MKARVGVFSGTLFAIKTGKSVTAPDIETRLTQLNREYQINKENYGEKLVEIAATQQSYPATSVRLPIY